MRLWDTPVPIPNTMVKTQAAEDTWWEAAWENRWSPESIILDSSAVEQPAVNRWVAGSNPARGAFFGPMVKRLRHGPFTAVTRVRFPVGSFSFFVPMWLNWQSS